MGFPVQIIENRKSKKTSSWLTLTSSWLFNVVGHFWFPVCRCWLWCISESSDCSPACLPAVPSLLTGQATLQSLVSGSAPAAQSRIVSLASDAAQPRHTQGLTSLILGLRTATKFYQQKLDLIAQIIFCEVKTQLEHSDPSISADRCVLWRWMWLVWKHHIWKVSFYVASFIMIVMLVQTQQE